MSNTEWRSDYLAPIAVTPGEPAGIGPDLIVTIAQRSLPYTLLIIADPALLQERAALLKLPLHITEYSPTRPLSHQPTGHLWVLPVHLRRPVTPGIPDQANAAYVLDTLNQAVRGCLDRQFAALVTGPVHKATINDAGFEFSGHTEFIAKLCGVTFPVMMLMNKNLRVALVTTHVPLSQVSRAITAERLEHTISVVNHDLRVKFGIAKPRLLLCGLNPHAGEQGYLGSEETTIIAPVVERLRMQGMALTGPVPADTAFIPASLKDIDAVITMYHDQGLPVLKAQGFGETVNITLGLPLIRTSVDHGTAFNLAGSGKADAASFLAAMACAWELSENNQHPAHA